MEVKINKEIRNYTESMFFGLSLRQFIFSVLACGVAVGLYFLLRPHFGTETLSWVCILGAAPFALMGFVKYNGMNAEQFVWAWIKSEFLTNVDTHSRLICYDILDLGKQLQPIGMLVVLDSILNRITQNRAKGRNTFIFIDEIYLLFQHEYSANFLFTLWKRVRKYGAYCTGITQNVDDLLQSHTARTMLANSEFIIMLNQASTDRIEFAKLLNISDLQLSYITNVGAGQGLLKVGSSLVPFVNKFPRNTELYKLMTTKFGEV